MIELNVHAILVSLLSRQRVVLLKERRGERCLPIWIGTYESEAIAMRLQETVVPRPLTHDLLVNVIADLGGAIQYVIVSELKNNTFYAKIAIAHDGKMQLIDSRSSDAIAVAVRASVPIFADESVMAQASIVSSPDLCAAAPSKEADDLDVFRDFVDTLDLDDLGD